MMTCLSRHTATWDETRQQAYRDKHPESVFVFHLLLDASGSMCSHEVQLRAACNMYLKWLQRHAPPMSLADLRCFGSTLQASHMRALNDVKLLTSETYSATYGGTALYDALGTVATQTPGPGHHILVVFTDGGEMDSEQWSEAQGQTLLTTLQDESGWLCVFLGAFADALPVAKTLGFKDGNCLTFGTEKIPEAFEALRRATEGYLLATPQDRKRLTQGGVFAQGESLCLL